MHREKQIVTGEAVRLFPQQFVLNRSDRAGFAGLLAPGHGAVGGNRNESIEVIGGMQKRLSEGEVEETLSHGLRAEEERARAASVSGDLSCC
jgi:hypothetical protein